MIPSTAQTAASWPAKSSVPGRGISFAPSAIIGLAGFVDALLIVLTGTLLYVGYVGWAAETASLYLAATAVYAVTVLMLFWRADFYTLDAIVQPHARLKNIVISCVIGAAIFATLGFTLKISSEFSRVWLFSFSLISTPLLYVGRVAVWRLVYEGSRAGYLIRNIVIVGSGPQAQRFASWIHGLHEPWNKIIGVFDDRQRRIGAVACGYPVLGTVEDLPQFVRQNQVDDIVIAMPWNADHRIFEITEKLRDLPVHLRVTSDLAGFFFAHRSQSGFGGIPVIEITKKPLSGWNVALKSAEDLVLASLLLVFFAPLMLCIALAIKIDTSGPVLFRQKRYGFNNQEILVLKFRTMYHGSCAPSGGAQARYNDPRITRVGRFLRRASLDELPQLFNVLGRTMSLVGPRPHAVEHNEHYASLIQGYCGRHRMKPGITGWAQVNGLRGETDTPGKMQARVEFDQHYIENWSLLFDLRILVKTLFVGFFHKNAY